MSADALFEAIAEEITRRVVAHLEARLPQPAQPQKPPPAPQWVDTRTAAKMLGLSRSTLEYLRAQGKPPAFVKIGGPGGAVRYSVEELHAFMAARTRNRK